MIREEDYSLDLREFIVMNEEHEVSLQLRDSEEKDPEYGLSYPDLLNAWRGAWLTWFEFPNGSRYSVLWFPHGANMLGGPEFEIYSFTTGEVIDRVATIREVEKILRKEARL